MKRHIIALLILVAGAVIFIALGVTDLAAKPAAEPSFPKKGEIVEYEAGYAKEILEVENKFFGLIHTHSDHYYITLTADGANALVIKANEAWFGDNFAPDGMAKGSVKVSGLVKQADGDLVSAVRKLNDELSSAEISFDTSLYADEGYKTEGRAKVLMGGLLAAITLIFGLFAALLSRGVISNGGIVSKALAVVMLLLALAIPAVGYMYELI